MIQKYKVFSLFVLMTACALTVWAQENAIQKWKKGVLVDEFIYDSAAFPSCHAVNGTPM